MKDKVFFSFRELNSVIEEKSAKLIGRETNRNSKIVLSKIIEKPLNVLLSRLPLLKLSTLGRYVVKFLKSKHLLSRHLSRQFALAAHLYFALLTFATFQCLNS